MWPALLINTVLAWNDGRVLEPELRPYLPASAFNDWQVTVWGERLRAMGETPLLELTPPSTRSFRLTVFRRQEAWCLRVMIDDRGARLETRVLSTDPSKLQVGRLSWVNGRTLTQSETEAVVAAFERVGSRDMPVESQLRGRHGSSWFLESVENGQWRVSQVWSPDLDAEKRKMGPLLSFARRLLELIHLRADLFERRLAP